MYVARGELIPQGAAEAPPAGALQLPPDPDQGPAIDRQAHSGDEACLVRGKEHCGIGNVESRTDATLEGG